MPEPETLEAPVTALDTLKAQAAALTPDQRDELASFLRSTLPLTGELLAECNRRRAELESGAVVGIPHEDLLAEMEAEDRE